MKKVIYCSDIRGTILGSQENKIEDYQKFNELLKEIKTREDADELVFSLISTDNQETVKSIQNLIHPYIKETATLGRQYFENGYYTERQTVLEEKPKGKVIQLIEYVNDLKKEEEEISVYYADDTEMYHFMAELLAKNNGWSSELFSIKPTGLGLEETNQLLEKHLEDHFGKQK